jgi:hypothetical protein
VEESLVALLLADAGLEALVTNRINWNVKPQASGLPAIILTEASGTPDYHAQGPSGLVESRVQVDVWGKTYGQMKTVARAVEARLSGMREISGGTQFQGAFLQSSRASFEEGSGGVQMHRSSMDFMVHHRKVQGNG